MVLVNYSGISRRVACAQCITGHRSRKCEHARRNLIEVRKPGRPLQACPHPPESAQCTCNDQYIFVLQGHEPITNENGEIVNIERTQVTMEYPKSNKSGLKNSHQRQARRSAQTNSSKVSSGSHSTSPDQASEMDYAYHDSSQQTSQDSSGLFDNAHSAPLRDGRHNNQSTVNGNYTPAWESLDMFGHERRHVPLMIKQDIDHSVNPLGVVTEVEQYSHEQSHDHSHEHSPSHSHGPTKRGCCMTSKRQASEETKNPEQTAKRGCCKPPQTDSRKRDSQREMKSCCSSSSHATSDSLSLNQAQANKPGFRPIAPAPVATLVDSSSSKPFECIPYLPVSMQTQNEICGDQCGLLHDPNGICLQDDHHDNVPRAIVLSRAGSADDCICETDECRCIDCAKHPYNPAQRAHVGHLLRLQDTAEYIAEEARLNPELDLWDLDVQMFNGATSHLEQHHPSQTDLMNLNDGTFHVMKTTEDDTFLRRNQSSTYTGTGVKQSVEAADHWSFNPSRNYDQRPAMGTQTWFPPSQTISHGHVLSTKHESLPDQWDPGAGSIPAYNANPLSTRQQNLNPQLSDPSYAIQRSFVEATRMQHGPENAPFGMVHPTQTDQSHNMLPRAPISTRQAANDHSTPFSNRFGPMETLLEDPSWDDFLHTNTMEGFVFAPDVNSR